MASPEQSFWPTLPSSGGMLDFSGGSKPQTKPATPSNSLDEDFGEELFDRLRLQDTLSIGGAIAEAIQKKEVTGNQTTAAKSKKKGKKGVTLFATGIAFAGSK